MPILTGLLSRFRRKEVAILNDGAGNRPSISVRGAWLPGAQWTPRTYGQQARAGYMQNSDVFACVSLISQASKQVAWWNGGSEPKSGYAALAKAIGNDPAQWIGGQAPTARQIKAAVNPRGSLELLAKVGGPNFIEHWVSFILLAGNAYMEVERLANGAIRYLYLDNPLTVEAIPDRQALHEQDAIAQWKVRALSQTRYLKVWRGPRDGDLVQSKLFNPLDPIYGMAPLEAAMLRIDAQTEGATLMKRILQRGYVPGWIEAAENSDWDERQVAQLKERLRLSKLQGEEVFLQNAKWHPIGFPPVDSGISEQSILTKRDIASVFHVPPQLIGDTTSQTYSNYREARRALYMEAVIPLLVQFRDDWNRTIGREINSPLEFDRDAFDAISAAREEAADRVHKLWTSGLITQNEGRSDLEYDPVADGDVFYAPANFIPLGVPPEPPPPDEGVD